MPGLEGVQVTVTQLCPQGPLGWGAVIQVQIIREPASESCGPDELVRMKGSMPCAQDLVDGAPAAQPLPTGS